MINTAYTILYRIKLNKITKLLINQNFDETCKGKLNQCVIKCVINETRFPAVRNVETKYFEIIVIMSLDSIGILKI